jgi:hypothetical protein
LYWLSFEDANGLVEHNSSPLQPKIESPFQVELWEHDETFESVALVGIPLYELF